VPERRAGIQVIIPQDYVHFVTSGNVPAKLGAEGCRTRCLRASARDPRARTRSARPEAQTLDRGFGNAKLAKATLNPLTCGPQPA
jgi:hypothetical protein